MGEVSFGDEPEPDCEDDPAKASDFGESSIRNSSPESGRRNVKRNIEGVG